MSAASQSKPNLRALGPHIGRLLALARPHRRRLAAGLVFLAIGSASGLAYPQAIRILIDGELQLDQAVLGLLALSLVQAVAIAYRHYLFTCVGERVVATLRTRLYAHIVEQEVGFFDTRRTGELANRLSSDTTVIQNTVSVNISMSLRALFGALGAAGMLVYTSPALAGVMLLIVPAIAIGAVVFGRKVKRLSRRMQDALAVAGEIAEETISAIRTVRAFTQERAEVERYRAAVDASYVEARKRAAVASLFSGGVSLATFAAIALIVWIGAEKVAAGELTQGQLASFLMYTVMVAISFGQLAGLWGDLMRAIGSAERVFELLDRKPAIPSTGGKIPRAVKGHLRFEGLRFAYPSRPDVPVLRGLDFEVAPGQVVALVGPSGGGKSTIASLIPRFYDPDEGAILLDEVSLRQLDATALRQTIGTVAQEPTLMATSVAANIRYGRREATEAEVQHAAKVANAHEFISAFPEGYDTLVGERGVQLSGGQKQRVAIARAVLKDPAILILDEATSALDSESEHLVQEALDRLMRGRTTLVIAHRLSTVVDADRVLVIESGAIAQAGTHDELMRDSNSTYRRLVERQFVRAGQPASDPEIARRSSE